MGVVVSESGRGLKIFAQMRKMNCYCCGGAGHNAAVCRLKDKVCHGCGKRGHIKSGRPRGAGPSHTMYHVTSGESARLLKIIIKMDDRSISMEVAASTYRDREDTGTDQ